MINQQEIKTRFLSDALPTRLGGIAANLARVDSFCRRDANPQAVFGLLDESKHFIEWTGTDASTDVAAELAELQIKLACWQLDWAIIWPDKTLRQQMAQESRQWSSRILEMSGLLGA